MRLVFNRFLRDENGATAIEYGLIAALLSGALVAGGMSLGNAINSTLGTTAEKLETSQ